MEELKSVDGDCVGVAGKSLADDNAREDMSVIIIEGVTSGGTRLGSLVRCLVWWKDHIVGCLTQRTPLNHGVHGQGPCGYNDTPAVFQARTWACIG